MVKATASLSPTLVPSVHARAAAAPGCASIDADIVVGYAGAGGKRFPIQKIILHNLDI